MAPDEPKSLKIWEFVPTYNSFQMRHLRMILVKLSLKSSIAFFFDFRPVWLCGKMRFTFFIN